MLGIVGEDLGSCIEARRDTGITVKGRVAEAGGSANGLRKAGVEVSMALTGRIKASQTLDCTYLDQSPRHDPTVFVMQSCPRRCVFPCARSAREDVTVRTSSAKDKHGKRTRRKGDTNHQKWDITVALDCVALSLTRSCRVCLPTTIAVSPDDSTRTRRRARARGTQPQPPLLKHEHHRHSLYDWMSQVAARRTHSHSPGHGLRPHARRAQLQPPPLEHDVQYVPAAFVILEDKKMHNDGDILHIEAENVLHLNGPGWKTRSYNQGEKTHRRHQSHHHIDVLFRFPSARHLAPHSPGTPSRRSCSQKRAPFAEAAPNPVCGGCKGDDAGIETWWTAERIQGKGPVL
ncbi:hypothetical protein GGX14DRAFT_408931 [Mycena pura]|uniref:Uncharacterized protein n=1 Tax=Mycena pura TaxID=153505 RepID=A0AAD6US33_9AGAR|nr:hypothetical protein GGX14DRAFT_408931 [Mycena pura]